MQQQKTPGYYETFKNALMKAWYYRFIWIWGIFLPVSFSFNMGFSENKGAELNNLDLPVNSQWQFIDWCQKNWNLILIGLAIFIVISLVFWFLSIIARGGIIKLLHQSQNLNDYKKFVYQKDKSVWQLGKKNTKKIIKLDLIFYLSVLSLFFIFLAPILTLLIAQKQAFLLIPLAIIFFVPLLFLFSIIRSVALINIVLANLRTFYAIERAYFLIIKNLKELFKLIFCFIILNFFISLALSSLFILIAIMFVGLLALLALTLKVDILQIFHYGPDMFFDNLSNEHSLVFLIAVIIFAIILLIITVWSKSILGIVKYDVWIWWTKKIQGVKVENEKKLLIDKISDEKTSTIIDYDMEK